MRRVVVTGMGVVSPIGSGVERFAAALFAGRSGVGRVSRFRTGELPTAIAAEVKDLAPAHGDLKRTFAVAAAAEALAAAGLGPAGGAAAESLGSAGGGAAAAPPFGLAFGLGLELFSMPERPADAPKSLPAEAAVHDVARLLRLAEPPVIHTSACAAATDALGTAFLRIRHGVWERALAGGADSMINLMGIAGFSRIRALSTRNDAPAQASRPFDAKRDGFVLGEGAAFLALEAEDAARARGATILAELAGYGNSQDAFHIADPDPGGVHLRRAMDAALRSAGLSADAIGAVSAHGTSTPQNDAVEARVLAGLLGDRAGEVPVMATKALIGHLIGAAGAVETVAAILALREQRVHGHPTLAEQAPECRGIRILRDAAAMPLDAILKNSMALGGQNSCLVIRRYRG